MLFVFVISDWKGSGFQTFACIAKVTYPVHSVPYGAS